MTKTKKKKERDQRELSKGKNQETASRTVTHAPPGSMKGVSSRPCGVRKSY